MYSLFRADCDSPQTSVCIFLVGLAESIFAEYIPILIHVGVCTVYCEEESTVHRY